MSAPITEPVRAKRQLLRTEEPSLKRQRGTQELKISYLSCKILIDGNWLIRNPREVLFNTHDFNRLNFVLESEDDNKYVLIANRLFIPSPSLQVPKGTIFMLPHQVDEIEEGVMKDNEGSKAVVYVPYPPSKSFVSVQSVTFEVAPFDDSFDSDKELLTQLVEELDADFSENFTDQFLIYGQTYVLKLANGLFVKFQIQSSTYQSSGEISDLRKRAKSRYIYITPTTKFDYVPKKGLTFVRQVTPALPETTEIVFKVASYGRNLEFQSYLDESKKLHHRLKAPLYMTQATYSITVKKVYDSIVKYFLGKVVLPGSEQRVTFPPREQVIRITCDKILINGDLAPSTREENYRAGVFYYPKCQVRIVPDHTVQLVTESSQPVKSISLAVTKVISSNSPNPLQPFRNRVDIWELKRTLHSHYTKLVEGAVLQVSLSTGDFLIEIISAKEDRSIDLQDDSSSSSSSSSDPDNSLEQIHLLEEMPYVKRPWELNSETKLHFFNSIPKELELIRNEKRVPLGRIVFRVSRLNAIEDHIQIHEKSLLNITKQLCSGALLLGETFNIKCEGSSLSLKIASFVPSKRIPKSRYSRLGKITSKTTIEFEAKAKQQIQIVSDSKYLVINDHALLMKDLELGGISEQMGLMLRRALLPRGKWAHEAHRRGINPIKGMLLYGPPGTGKTSLATKLGAIFGCTLKNGRLKMITAPEIFNKWVGNSEENVRKLFEGAEKDLKRYGPERAPLHLIVIDELDGAFGERGDKCNSVRDSVVNQLLGKLEESKPPENIMIVGITNRKENIDTALLRKGRLGLHLEFNAPTVKGREEIFEIYTAKLKAENLLADDIDIKRLAELTEGKTGSDIRDLVHEASTYSLERISQASSVSSRKERKRIEKVTMDDLMKALEGATKKPPSYLQELYL